MVRFDTLPPELVTRILYEATPSDPAPASSYPELLSFSLISQFFAPFAQELIHGRVEMSTEMTARMWLENRYRGCVVRELVLRGSNRGSTLRTETALEVIRGCGDSLQSFSVGESCILSARVLEEPNLKSLSLSSSSCRASLMMISTDIKRLRVGTHLILSEKATLAPSFSSLRSLEATGYDSSSNLLHNILLAVNSYTLDARFILIPPRRINQITRRFSANEFGSRLTNLQIDCTNFGPRSTKDFLRHCVPLKTLLIIFEKKEHLESMLSYLPGGELTGLALLGGVGAAAGEGAVFVLRLIHKLRLRFTKLGKFVLREQGSDWYDLEAEQEVKALCHTLERGGIAVNVQQRALDTERW